MKKCLDYYLEKRMNSTDGDKIKETLEAISLEEKNCLELFKIQINWLVRELLLGGILMNL